jgi:hypothetical protein
LDCDLWGYVMYRQAINIWEKIEFHYFEIVFSENNGWNKYAMKCIGVNICINI